MRLLSAMPTLACTRTQGFTMNFSHKALSRALLLMFALLALLCSTGARAQNNAAFVSQSVPTSMLTGTTYNVTVAMSNTGGTTWTAANSLFLGSQNPENNSTWGGGRVAMLASVGPGGQANFAFQIIAPSAPGTYNFQWRMLQEGVEWFGAFTPNVAVTVSAAPPHNDAQVIGVSVPAVMTQGQGYTVAVTLKNSGNTTWPAGSAYALGSTIPQNTMLWGVNRVPLNSAVPPGQQTTLSFQVPAPAAGSYSMGWGDGAGERGVVRRHLQLCHHGQPAGVERGGDLHPHRRPGQPGGAHRCGRAAGQPDPLRAVRPDRRRRDADHRLQRPRERC
jgi:hypothetical protein